MKGKIIIKLLTLLMSGVMVVSMFQTAKAQSSKTANLFGQENLVAWCIVPFDSKNRNPEQRITMLKNLNFSQYAYDWRHQHLDSFAEEIRLARKNNIRISAVWLWIDRNSDSPGKLSDDNERLLKILTDEGLKTQLWVGFSNNYFDLANDQEKVKVGSEMVSYLRSRTKTMSTSIGLYNHGDWFGEPDNQIQIIKQVNDPLVGIIYNFHHAHQQVDKFAELLKHMSPWLWCVNIDGVKKDGPQILPVGSGNEELGMLKTLKASGYQGSIGILGHIETEDVEVVLKRNLDGLNVLAKKM
ncbi:MAG: hypothetical protein ABI477_14900 [Chryseolinea sp.]